MGGSAEIRRAYSALYGRFFARAALMRHRGLRWFQPLHTNSTTYAGAVVNRVAKGDIPDWIAWDTAKGRFALCEAKGSLSGSTDSFLTTQPTCVSEGKAQFTRVTVKGLTGHTLATDNWVVATLWSTDARPRQPVTLLWDPPGEGEVLGERERAEAALEMRRGWALTLAPLILGNRSASEYDWSNFVGQLPASVQITVKPRPFEEAEGPSGSWITSAQASDVGIATLEAGAFEDLASVSSHRGRYVLAVMDELGVHPLDATAGHLLDNPKWRSMGHLLVGLRDDIFADRFESAEWLSGSGVVGPEGLALFDSAYVVPDGAGS